jgi:hypothetical protein
MSISLGPDHDNELGNKGQPLSAAFEKIIQAIGLYDHWIDVQGNHLDDAEQWSQHAVQSVVWSAAGELPVLGNFWHLSTSMQDAKNWRLLKRILSPPSPRSVEIATTL